MTGIDRLIYDELAARRSVVLEGVGTLEVKRRGAKKISETQIIPPQNVVTFTPDRMEGVLTVVEIIASGQTVPAEEAAALYASWLEGARHPDGDSVGIDGAGEIKDGRFVIGEGLHMALNPTKEEEIVTMETERRSIPLWAWIIIGLLAAQLLFGLFWCIKTGVFTGVDRPGPVVETVVIAEPEPVVDQATLDAQAAAQAAAEAAAAEAAKPAGPVYHVIAGAFAIESNADDFMARVKRQHSDLTPEKLVNPVSGYHMVSIYQSADQRQAITRMNLYWDIDLYLWIYTEK